MSDILHYLPPELAEIEAQYEEETIRLTKTGLTLLFPRADICYRLNLPCAPGLYRILQAPFFYSFNLTYIPVIIYRFDLDLSTLPPIKVISNENRFLIDEVILSDSSKSFKVHNSSAAVMLENVYSLYTDHNQSQIGAVLLFSRSGSLESRVSSFIQHYNRTILVEEMRRFLTNKASKIRGSDVTGSISFTLSESEAARYKFPQAGRIMFAPSGKDPKPDKNFVSHFDSTSGVRWEKISPYYTNNNIEHLAGSVFADYLRGWFQRMYNAEKFPDRDPDLMDVYRKIMKDNEGLWSVVIAIKVIGDKIRVTGAANTVSY